MHEQLTFFQRVNIIIRFNFPIYHASPQIVLGFEAAQPRARWAYSQNKTNQGRFFKLSDGAIGLHAAILTFATIVNYVSISAIVREGFKNPSHGWGGEGYPPFSVNFFSANFLASRCPLRGGGVTPFTAKKKIC